MKLTIPALYTVNSTQPDSRWIEITLDLLFEGACFGKYLFPLEAINVAAPDIKNIPILAEEGTYGVGVIPESAGSRWTKLFVNGKWRNYLQVDALLWTKMQDKLPDFQENSKDFYNIEVDLTDIKSHLQEDGLYAVSSFKIGGCRLTQQATDYTAFTSRYGNLPKR
ncbi:MAG: hypothetical protein K2P14_06990 [Anaeroplasmataceae bacterium]|nr:hypothetical protein [Anaeroplasmataceae bacterium]